MRATNLPELAGHAQRKGLVELVDNRLSLGRDDVNCGRRASPFTSSSEEAADLQRAPASPRAASAAGVRRLQAVGQDP
jgi:hypothetical protein